MLERGAQHPPRRAQEQSRATLRGQSAIGKAPFRLRRRRITTSLDRIFRMLLFFPVSTERNPLLCVFQGVRSRQCEQQSEIVMNLQVVPLRLLLAPVPRLDRWTKTPAPFVAGDAIAITRQLCNDVVDVLKKLLDVMAFKTGKIRPLPTCSRATARRQTICEGIFASSCGETNVNLLICISTKRRYVLSARSLLGTQSKPPLDKSHSPTAHANPGAN